MHRQEFGVTKKRHGEHTSGTSSLFPKMAEDSPFTECFCLPQRRRLQNNSMGDPNQGPFASRATFPQRINRSRSYLFQFGLLALGVAYDWPLTCGVFLPTRSISDYVLKILHECGSAARSQWLILHGAWGAEMGMAIPALTVQSTWKYHQTPLRRECAPENQIDIFGKIVPLV